MSLSQFLAFLFFVWLSYSDMLHIFGNWFQMFWSSKDLLFIWFDFLNEFILSLMWFRLSVFAIFYRYLAAWLPCLEILQISFDLIFLLITQSPCGLFSQIYILLILDPILILTVKNIIENVPFWSLLCWVKQDLNEQIWLSIYREHKTVPAGIQRWNGHQTYQDGDWNEGVARKAG